MSTEVAKVLAVAAKEVGYQEKRSGGHWVNDSKFTRWFGTIPGYSQDGYGYPWCAVYVAWCADQADLARLYPKTASCLVAVKWFKDKKRFSEYPAVGAQIFFGSGGGAHTGIVYSYDETYVYTYEGNTNTSGSAEGDGVYKKKRVRRDAYVYGYGYPEFDEGIVTADPSKKGLKGYTYKPTASAPKAEPEKEKPAPPKKTTPSKPKPPAFPGRGYFRPGAYNSYVERLGKQLVKKGYGRYYQVGPGPRWSNADKQCVAAFQRAQGWKGKDADGYPGPETWKRLFS